MTRPSFPPAPPLASPQQDPAETAAAIAGSLRGTLRLARELVLARRDIDLAGLDDQIGRLCARALDLPPEQGDRVRPELCSLLETVDALDAALCDTAPD